MIIIFLLFCSNEILFFTLPLNRKISQVIDKMKNDLKIWGFGNVLLISKEKLSHPSKKKKFTVLSKNDLLFNDAS